MSGRTETRAMKLERCNYEMIKGQQQIMLAANEAERLEKSEDISMTPQALIDTIDAALSLIEEATPIVNSAGTVTDEVRAQNNENLTNMRAKATETRNKVSTKLAEITKNQIKTHFASLLNENTELAEEYYDGKNSMQQFRIWTDEYFSLEKYELKEKARHGLIDWDVAELKTSQLNKLKLKLSHNYYEIEKLKAKKRLSDNKCRLGGKRQISHGRAGVGFNQYIGIYAFQNGGYNGFPTNSRRKT